MTLMIDSFLKEAPPRQLGVLAATLARIASSSVKPARTTAIVPMLSECIEFIEKLTPPDSPKAKAELKDLGVMLGLWRESWLSVRSNESQRQLLSLQAKKWSDLVLEYSGLLNSS
jgi:hypothetical protein